MHTEMSLGRISKVREHGFALHLHTMCNFLALLLAALSGRGGHVSPSP